jgi:uncharacterized protein YndB with AHSA1/START domain
MTENELIIVRTFNAPREAVWQAWTEPDRMMRWLGPKGFTTPFCTMDLRIGGTYLNCMRSPEGKEYWSTGQYREVDPPALLVYTDSFADADGNVVPATYYGMEGDFPLTLLVKVTFEGDAGITLMTLRHFGIPPGKPTDQCRTGWGECFDKLEASLR